MKRKLALAMLVLITFAIAPSLVLAEEETEIFNSAKWVYVHSNFGYYVKCDGTVTNATGTYKFLSHKGSVTSSFSGTVSSALYSSNTVCKVTYNGTVYEHGTYPYSVSGFKDFQASE